MSKAPWPIQTIVNLNDVSVSDELEKYLNDSVFDTDVSDSEVVTLDQFRDEILIMNGIMKNCESFSERIELTDIQTELKSLVELFELHKVELIYWPSIF